MVVVVGISSFRSSRSLGKTAPARFASLVPATANTSSNPLSLASVTPILQWAHSLKLVSPHTKSSDGESVDGTP